jgi:hypothetical protein
MRFGLRRVRRVLEVHEFGLNDHRLLRCLARLGFGHYGARAAARHRAFPLLGLGKARKCQNDQRCSSAD